MNRRRAPIAMLAVAAATMLPGLHAAANKPSRPNILLIITDQQFADVMSCVMGKKYIDTPAMDGIAANGMRFTRAYTANPLCMPCRTSLFTGRYPHETGVQSNGGGKIDTGEMPIMGAYFRDAGYDTGYVGKWHIAASSKSSGFTYCNTSGKDPQKLAPLKSFLNKKRTKPFLLVASFMNPHNVCELARKERLPDGPIGEPPPVDECPPLMSNHEVPENETDTILTMRKAYQSWHREKNGKTRYTFPVGTYDEKEWRQFIWGYYRLVEKVDALIGELLKDLRDAGHEKNTLIVFTSDHGDCHGAHKWNQKTVFYDESVRVPFIVSQKGVTKKGTSDRLVNTGIDTMPTLFDYAGIKKPGRLPGVSVRDTANGKAAHLSRDYVVVCNKMYQQDFKVDRERIVPEGRMVRSTRYKYCVYSWGKRRESLVDMEKDPGEMRNVAGVAEYADTLAQHRQYLVNWCKQYGDDFPVVRAR